MGRIISVVASAIMVICLLAHPLSAQQRSMTIGMTNWAENIAVANLWKILLAERGYQAELRTVDIAVETNFTAPASIGDRNRNLGLGCVQPDERFRFLAHGSTLVSRQAGQSQPLPLLLIA